MAILVATDLSFRSEPALRRALQLGRNLSLPVEIAHVVDSDLPAELRDQSVAWAETALKRELDDMLTPDAGRPNITLLVGKARRAIVEHAHKTAADLIVVGLHDSMANGMFGFADTTAGHILRSSDLPVLLVKSRPQGPYGQALVGVDFSIFTKAAIRHAQRFFPGTHLILAHAYSIPFKLRLGTPEYIAEMTAQAAREFETFLKDELSLLLERATARRPGAGRIDTRLVEGLPASVLRAEQARTSADVLVIGTHGTSGLTRAIWGSVAQEMLDHPPCDILVVHGF